MIVKEFAAKRRRVEQLLDGDHTYPVGDLSGVAAKILEKRAAILDAAARHRTPLYLFDGRGFAEALAAFSRAFDEHVRGHRPFYAVKSNHHPHVVEGAVRAGYGLDVSSGRELRQALQHDGCSILFSGPAKTEEDLELAVAHADRTLVHLDSFRELERLGRVTSRLGRPIRAGVRVSTAHHGAWSKFGIPLGELARCFREAQQHPLVDLQGIQLHLSWNRDASPYRRIIEDLGRCLAHDLTAEQRARLRFIDVGGGYRPHRLEGYYPTDHPLGQVISAADAHFGEDTEFVHPYYIKDSIPVDEYAREIGAAIDDHLRPIVDCVYYTEPGRIVSTYAMHIALTVVDKKRDDLVIVDGGINMVGWEKYLQIYCPVVNVTRPADREIPVRIGGSLCDCEDVWGLRCYAEAIEEGDVLVVPFQGAYTFSVAQEFIRPIPAVCRLDEPDDGPR
ncbi:decarboxylase [Sorangium cellulosum]|uniref:Decarboxylase n=1 Tax=Sorangium cellulosum TaxID=56 RepID=A0A2L0F6X1_SORCE|nr:alanine racemase [Sorangium cellulosum]AUX47344.1 decarboxylase [Sorangium cellulosum]